MNLFGMFYGNGEGHESSRQAHPEGIRLHFSVIKWHWGRLIALNLIFIVSCIPVVTIPCAMTAMSKVTGLFLQRRICYPTHDYLKAFGAEWKRSTLAGWTLWLIVLLGAFGAWLYPKLNIPGGVALAGVCIMFVLFAFAAMIYVFPMIAFTDLRVRDLLKNGILLAVMKLPQTVAALLVAVAIIAFSYLLLPWTVWVMPVLGFSLIALTGTYVAWNAMKRYVITDDDHSSAGESYADSLDASATDNTATAAAAVL